MPDRALRMGNTCGLSRGSRGTALISRPWAIALSRRPVARPLSPARLRRYNLNSDIRKMEHQEYPKGAGCRVFYPCFANARFVYLCNPYATKGFLQRSPFSNAQVRTGAIQLPIPASAVSADGQPEPHPPA